MKTTILALLAGTLACSLDAALPITPAQSHYLEHDVMAIVHWGLNTYTGQEWGDGTTDPVKTFPRDIGKTLNPEQWVKAMKAGGISKAVLVSKHHDGFCLWPAEGNDDYSTKAFPKGHTFRNYDLVDRFAKACRKHGIAFGVYISPWDRHHADWGHDDGKYYTYFHRHFTHLVSDYGKVWEMWFDGAVGDWGHYGGVRERRKLPKPAADYYDFQKMQDELNAHNPLAVVFGSGCSNGVCWAGNELGKVGERWKYEREGRGRDRRVFSAPEADTPIGGSASSAKGAWFWHKDHVPKSLKQMVQNYFESVGRGGVLNWGIAPDQRGLIPDGDVKRLKEFGDYVRTFNAINLAKGASVQHTMKDKADGIAFHLSGPVTFNAVDFGEDLSKGQLATGWKVEAWLDNAWQELAKGSDVGYRRIARFGEVKSSKVRISVKGSGAGVRIVRPAVRFAPTVNDNGSLSIGETHTADWMTGREKEKK